MKIGIVSDTHRNKEYLNSVVDWLISSHRIEALYHLGDDYEDTAAMADKGIEIVQVPGIYHQKYRDGSLKPKHLETIRGLRILLVHSIEKDITENDRTVADIILHGHTHHAELRLADGLMIMNPGHLKGPKDKMVEPSFGLLEIRDQEVAASIFNLQHAEIDRLEMFRSENGLYKT